MAFLFSVPIRNLESWGNVFQSIAVFEPLIKYIFKKENLPFTKIEHCTPGSNAVFRVGRYIIKIFAPKESEIGSTEDSKTEIFAMSRANELGISAPKLVASGLVEDTYPFYYILMEWIDGSDFTEASKPFSFEEKVVIGQKLRKITDRMNTPCEPFNKFDVTNDISRFKRWDCYPKSFQEERQTYIQSHNFGSKVFVHGDLCASNLLIAKNQELYIIDFADAILAPVIYEQALIACELFDFDKAYIQGYFGNCGIDELTELCFNGLLLHQFGGNIIRQHIGEVSTFVNLDSFKNALFLRLSRAME